MGQNIRLSSDGHAVITGAGAKPIAFESDVVRTLAKVPTFRSRPARVYAAGNGNLVVVFGGIGLALPQTLLTEFPGTTVDVVVRGSRGPNGCWTIKNTSGGPAAEIQTKPYDYETTVVDSGNKTLGALLPAFGSHYLHHILDHTYHLDVAASVPIKGLDVAGLGLDEYSLELLLANEITAQSPLAEFGR